jgi:dTMP kinase
MSVGKLIVFEGAEGAGKTTQIRLLAERLAGERIPCIVLREPGGTPVGDAIRAIVLAKEGEMSAGAESLLFMASRAELVAREVKPALERGTVVILDRFFLSTYAYQIVGRGLPEEDVRAANHLATAGLVPDITILLDISAKEGMDRAAQRGGRDRVEKAGDEFHERVNDAFRRFAGADWQRAHEECGPIVRVDGTGAESEIAKRIDKELGKILSDAPRNRVAAKA